jgi:hypothetical protein
MSSEKREASGRPAPAGTHCEWCGADYGGDGPGPRPDHPHHVSAPPGSAPTPVGDPGVTHCEWCGAEYPLPDQKG